jgi:uncharacterized membrane protein HdeD (DUF308 family)
MDWMHNVSYANVLRGLGITAGVIGIIIGLDLIFGAPWVSALRRILEKPFDFDKIITNRKARIILGIVFLILSIIIFLQIKK